VQLPEPGNVRTILALKLTRITPNGSLDSPQKYQPPQLGERIIQFASAVTGQDYVQARRQCDLLRRQIKNIFAKRRSPVNATMASPPSAIEPIEQSNNLDPSRTRNTWAI